MFLVILPLSSLYVLQAFFLSEGETPMYRRACYSIVSAISLLAFAIAPVFVSAQTPVSWWRGDGNALDSSDGNNGTLQGGVIYASAVVNQGFQFNGTNGVVKIADADNLKITGSISITAWVNVAALPTNGFGQILFRGDNRGALDPYYLAVNSAGNLVWQVGDAVGGQAFVTTPIPLQQNVFVTASLDDSTGAMRLSFGDTVVAQTITTVRPFDNLNSSFTPGLGIGNTQDPVAANQPFNGIIDELKIYNRVVGPVPAPSALAAFVIGAVPGAAVLLRRRRKA